MSFPPSFASLSNASASIPPPPGKGKPTRNVLSSPSATGAAALPTTAFRSRPPANGATAAAGGNAAQKNFVDQSLSALFSNRELLHTVCKNPMVQSLGKQAVVSMVRQQGKEIIGRATGALGGDNANKTRNFQQQQRVAMNNSSSSGAATQRSSTMNYQMSGGNQQQSVEKELEDIFGPLSLEHSSNKMLSSSSTGVRPPPSAGGVGQFQWSSSSAFPAGAPFIAGSSAPLYPILDRYSPPSALIDLKIPSLSTNWESGQCRAMALYDFDTAVPGDLKFAVNDWITVISRVNGEWLRGELASGGGCGGRRGIFPANYVQIGPAELSRLPREDDDGGRKDRQQGKRHQFLRALYDYESQMAGDLCFRAGDLIELVAERSDSEWAMGKLGGRSGLVPLTFVERI